MPAPPVDPFSEWVLRHTILPFIRRVWRPVLVDTGFFPEGPCFVYGNHSHNLDPFILNLFTAWGNPTSGVMTLEYLRRGPVAHMFRGIGLLGTRKAVPEPFLIRRIYERLDAGRAVVIYPEGGRRWDGRPAPWQAATAKIFARAGVPVYPVVTHGSYVGWPRWARWPRPARIQVECLPPFHFARGTSWQDVEKTLLAPIDIDENVVSDPIRPRRAFRPAAGIERLLYRDPATGENGALRSPDGVRVVNRAGTIRWTMRPDSTLLDEQTGDILLTGDLYRQIKSLPLEKDREGAFLQNEVRLHEEHEAPALVPRGRVRALLFEDTIRLYGNAIDVTLDLNTVRYVGIERSHKLQLTRDEGPMLQLSFVHGGSALQWQDTIQRLQQRAETYRLETAARA